MSATENPETLEPRTVDSSSEGSNPSRRTEIDTSAPFESVKEAANRFGGMGFWKPTSRKPSELAPEHYDEVIDVDELEERAAKLERDLIAKERETLDVLKELESSKFTVEQLKAKLQKEASEINSPIGENGNENGNVEYDICPSSAPGLILLELKQAKLNLTRTTSDLAEIQATVEQYTKEIEHERASLEKTRKRLTSNTSKISSLEKELNKTRQIHAEVQDAPHESSDIATQLQKLSSETEQFKKAGQAAKSQFQNAMSEIEQTRASIRTAEIKLIAAKRMKEAARASERVALADIRLLTKKTGGAHQESDENVITITVEEYTSLIQKARESERTCETRVDEAMVGVEEANVSRADFLKRVEEALEEVKISKRVLEEALERVEIANRDKLVTEETFRALRSEHDHKSRTSVLNPTKFKNSKSSSVHRRESILVDGSDEAKPVLKATLSIGEILSRKLMLTEEYENGTGKGKSFGRMLSKPSSCDPCKKSKNFGLGRISVLVVKQSKKKNKKD